ncbi:MAG TPA: cytochrome c [Chitinophagaceae bacterium]|jgi:cytochrome c553|nr:cytochrome c [Chitinophagaceae bacterium]
MKKIYISTLMVMMALFFSYCHSTKKAAAAAPAAATSAFTYEKSVQPILMNSCAPCHIPSKGGNKVALDSYANAKNDVEDILKRIQMAPEDRGFMPMRHPKLSDTDIATIKSWKDGGLIEK